MAVENDLIERHGEAESREEWISLERRERVSGEPHYKLQITRECKNNYATVLVLDWTVDINFLRNPVIVPPSLSQGVELVKRTVLHLTIPQVNLPRSSLEVLACHQGVPSSLVSYPNRVIPPSSPPLPSLL